MGRAEILWNCTGCGQAQLSEIDLGVKDLREVEVSCDGCDESHPVLNVAHRILRLDRPSPRKTPSV